MSIYCELSAENKCVDLFNGVGLKINCPNSGCISYGCCYDVSQTSQVTLSSVNSSILGSYILSRDSIKPEVKPLNFSLNKDISKQGTIRLRIFDNISGIKSYEVLINNKWALFEYEPKSNLIFHTIKDGIIKNGENSIDIKVKDGVGNETKMNSKVYWSN